LAARSGVSQRTVYGFFRDKAARIEAIDEWIDSFAYIRPLLPTRIDGIADYVAQRATYLFENETHTRVLQNRGPANNVRNYRKRIYIDAMVKALP
ncbi:MAG: hypothetical protein HKP25_12905, partial [Marinicaulis sp.]|nr:hypothetical protein [Marinicaulis sp.]